jgi:hypothetical protein
MSDGVKQIKSIRDNRLGVLEKSKALLYCRKIRKGGDFDGRKKVKAYSC